MQNGAAATENSMEVIQKLKIELPYDPAISFLGIDPKDVQLVSQRDINMPMFIAVLFSRCRNNLYVHQQMNG